MDFARLLFSPEGRIGQRDFWIGFLILFVGGVLIHAVALVGTVVWLLSVYCWVCLFAKRLHDMGRSGFAQVWIWLFDMAVIAALIVGGFGAILMGIFTSGHISWALMAGGLGLLALALLVISLAKLVFVLWVGLSRGQAGENRYGPEPA
jgi:uncharacterized membrane protein YhaH (DUF805 family)